jgi:hypothetical protein
MGIHARCCFKLIVSYGDTCDDAKSVWLGMGFYDLLVIFYVTGTDNFVFIMCRYVGIFTDSFMT